MKGFHAPIPWWDSQSDPDMTRLQLVGRSLASLIARLDANQPMTKREISSSLRQVRYWVRETEREHFRTELLTSPPEFMRAALAALDPIVSVGLCPTCENPLICDTSNSLRAAGPADATATSSLPAPAFPLPIPSTPPSPSSVAPKDPPPPFGSRVPAVASPPSFANVPTSSKRPEDSAQPNADHADVQQLEPVLSYRGTLTDMPLDPLVREALMRLQAHGIDRPEGHADDRAARSSESEKS
jgi:hypothetical protein